MLPKIDDECYPKNWNPFIEIGIEHQFVLSPDTLTTETKIMKTVDMIQHSKSEYYKALDKKEPVMSMQQLLYELNTAAKQPKVIVIVIDQWMI